MKQEYRDTEKAKRKYWKDFWSEVWKNYYKLSTRKYVDQRGRNKDKEELLSPRERYWNHVKSTISDVWVDEIPHKKANSAPGTTKQCRYDTN